MCTNLFTFIRSYMIVAPQTKGREEIIGFYFVVYLGGFHVCLDLSAINKYFFYQARRSSVVTGDRNKFLQN